jgi:hypothetical protein
MGIKSHASYYGDSDDDAGSDYELECDRNGCPTADSIAKQMLCEAVEQRKAVLEKGLPQTGLETDYAKRGRQTTLDMFSNGGQAAKTYEIGFKQHVTPRGHTAEAEGEGEGEGGGIAHEVQVDQDDSAMQVEKPSAEVEALGAQLELTVIDAQQIFVKLWYGDTVVLECQA